MDLLPVYLGIDANDDEWKSMKKRNRGAPGKQANAGAADQTWNPKGVSLKGVSRDGQRPQREGVKREIMESTLAESTKYDPTAASATAKSNKAAKVKREKKEAAKPKPPKESITKISTEPKSEFCHHLYFSWESPTPPRDTHVSYESASRTLIHCLFGRLNSACPGRSSVVLKHTHSN